MYTIAGSLLITFGYAQTDTTGQKETSIDFNRATDSVTLNRSHDMDMNSRTYPPATQSSESKDHQKLAKDHSEGVIMKADGIIMKDGTMYMVKNNMVTTIDQAITLDDGTKVMADGSYTKKDGKRLTLKEGEHLDMMGIINPNN